MTEPEHIPLTARLREYAEGWAEEFRHLLQVPDDALVHLGDAPEPEVWGGGCECWVAPEHLWTTHYGAVEPGSQLQFNPECPMHGSDDVTEEES